MILLGMKRGFAGNLGCSVGSWGKQLQAEGTEHRAPTHKDVLSSWKRGLLECWNNGMKPKCENGDLTKLQKGQTAGRKETVNGQCTQEGIFL